MAWNGSAGVPVAPVKPSKGKHSYWFWILVLAAIVLVVLFALQKSTPEQPVVSDKKPRMIREYQPQVTPTATNRQQKVKPSVATEKPIYQKKAGQMQLPDGKILTFPPPKEGDVAKVYAYGHLYECDHLGNFRDISKRKLFDTAFEENFLEMANGGKYISAFLTGLDEEQVLALLKKDYVQKGDESEDELAKLVAYNETRKAALMYVQEGGKFDDFIEHIVKFDREERSAQLASYSTIMNLVKEGKITEAREMADAANTLLETKGFKPLVLPQHIDNYIHSNQ